MSALWLLCIASLLWLGILLHLLRGLRHMEWLSPRARNPRRWACFRRSA